MNIFIQLVGFVGLILSVSSLQINNRRKLLIVQIASSIVFAIYYLLLDAYAGCYLAIVMLVRNIIFAVNKQKLPTAWFVVLLIAILCLTGLAYKSPIDLLPTVGITLYTIALWINKMPIIRKGYISYGLFYIAYNILAGAYIAAISSVIEIISASVSIYRYDIKKKKSKTSSRH